MKLWSMFAAGLLLSGMAWLMATSVSNDSPTSDEPPHILSGYVALKYGHDYIDIEHPLLAKTFAASPLLFQNLKVDLKDPNYTEQRANLDIGDLFKTSRAFMNYQGNNPDQILFSTRFMMILLAVGFGVVVFLFAKQIFGQATALLAVFLYATEPNILANGSLFNTDMPATGFILLTIVTLYLYARSQTSKRLILLTLALTGGFLTKFSTFYLLPIVLVAIFFLHKGDWRQILKRSAFVVLGSLLLICLFYGVISFRDRGLAGFFPVLFFQGLGRVVISVSIDGRYTYLLGQGYEGGRFYYFPVMLATKTQLLTLFGFGLSLLLLFLRKIKLDQKTLWVTLGPVAVLFGTAVISKFNIGVRHILPIYPILIIFAAGGLVAALRLTADRLRLTTKIALLLPLIVLLVSLRLWSVSTTYPHFLSYYNQVAGGTDNGWKVADDANYDWGQDVKRLANIVEKNHITSIAFDNYTGDYAAKDYYHIPVTKISPRATNYKGYIALSTSVITFHAGKAANYSWVVDKHQPLARAGKSIFIYKID